MLRSLNPINESKSLNLLNGICELMHVEEGSKSFPYTVAEQFEALWENKLINVA